MPKLRLLLLMPMVVALVACNREQPSGVPDTPAGTVAVEKTRDAPAPESLPSASSNEAVGPIATPPPPLDSEIPAFAKTGFPDCDEYIEAYRQCLNSRLGGDERKAKAGELNDSMRSILGNIGRGVDPARVAKNCKKARGLAAKKLTDLGCAI